MKVKFLITLLITIFLAGVMASFGVFLVIAGIGYIWLLSEILGRAFNLLGNTLLMAFIFACLLTSFIIGGMVGSFWLLDKYEKEGIE